MDTASDNPAPEPTRARSSEATRPSTLSSIQTSNAEAVVELAEGATDIPPTPRDVQRGALEDLLLLSRQLASLEADLQAKHKQAGDESQKAYDRMAQDLDHRLADRTKQVRAKADERRAELERQVQAERAKVEQQHRHRRDKATAEYDAVRSSVKRDYDQAVWLADSVLEAAQLKGEGEYKLVLDQHNDLLTAQSSAEAEAAMLAQAYGQKAVPADQPTLYGDTLGQGADTQLALEKANVEGYLKKLRTMLLPRLFVGIRPYLIVLLVVAGGGALGQYQTGIAFDQPQWREIGTYAGAALGGLIVLAVILKILAAGQVKKTYGPLRTAIANGRVASAGVVANAALAQDEAVRIANGQRADEVAAIKARLQPIQSEAVRKRDEALAGADAERAKHTDRLDAYLQKHRGEQAKWQAGQEADLKARRDADAESGRLKFENETGSAGSEFKSTRAALQKRWNDGLAKIHAPIGQQVDAGGASDGWAKIDWSDWTPPTAFPKTVPFGQLTVDLKEISAGIPRDGTFELALPDQFAVPALLAFPHQASLLIQTDPAGRDEGLRALQAAMVRVLTGLPPGRARFTIIDPVGLGQSFAGFMHLADHDESLVNGRIWTSPEQIEQRLADLTDHMETVIQKYLRNEFETIDDYNRQAGELAEPYRFLVIADFPNGFEGEAWRRLLSVAKTGARCGVYVMVLRDTRQPLPGTMHIEDLESVSVNLVRENGRFVWKDDVYQQFPLALNAPPGEETLTRIVHRVGKAAKEAARVEVSFDAIAPKYEQFWTQSAAEELSAPVGRMGATRLQYFRVGRGMAQHALTAGKTGSGKSTLLHAMVTNMAMWYSPDEVEFYLIDFKKGVEFKTYADYQLPHARAIAVESDREFGLSVLQRIDAELTRRGELYRKAGVQDLASYRKTADAQVMPRTLLVIDEFQEFFSEDDKLAQDASLLLDRLVRQGRAFGIHVFLGSQTIGGSGGLARTTIGQMGVRIALQCSEADSQLILGDNNSAARLLSRPGEAIYNDAGGLVENNSPFQVAWLSDSRREQYLKQVKKRLEADGDKKHPDPPIVFEGNAPADITKNAPLMRAVRHRTRETAAAPAAWIGDPVAIKEPTAVVFRRQSGTNLLIIGQQEEQALAIIESAMISIAAQQASGGNFYVCDGTPADSMFAGHLPKLAGRLPGDARVIEYRGVDETINELSEEVARRRDLDNLTVPSIFLVINGLQRYRSLRKSEDDFSFSTSDEDKKPNAGKQFAELLREGPPVGVHVIAWCDTLASVERTLERGSIREFDNRVLFQMSANDSSNLIDSPAANRLGFFRALVYSEEQGVMEKFRPYGLPDDAWAVKTLETLATSVTPG